ncbi:MAG: glutamine synthetase III [Sphaerochaeta sp.]|jgi:glutamine synthetase|uniref:glutamine synthetase III family protein n=1 Tax=Sphaerochaeta sp. TaxID=1972642 RepID=UPI002584A2F6|nr:glutamine synthetase III [Sphaerochaeta sp.]MDD3424431.1 glutamine synthetase III [Sphaerochaeta sp.]MDD4037652.1 glutamine synthetase III [Sphaerochaeta sp.]MDT3358157.1 glutamine synthetase III [Spirochaetota bacterium]
MTERVDQYFGSMVFGDRMMREYLAKDTYRELKQTIREGKELDITIANQVAHAMKEWALSKGATHFTHWFQPMTGITAEKHESFISPAKDGSALLEFSGKELIKGEPDASSFPSGGLRATFEARGYTAWDPSSYAFIKENTLCIPTAFCSYSGEVLDKKTPLLRSMEVISTQALRILKLFGKTEVKRVVTTVGPEQEYFLIDKSLYLKRKDLIHTGRTLLGARPPKGQELEDHYFGNLKSRVSAFMRELDEELWKLGILAKTEHNEVAPSQHELAPIFTTSNLAVDHNQLTMEMMKKTADKHGLVCLLHEKPFAGVNGSGKHNNWSISTDTGINLLEPGDNPKDNAQFLLFLVAVIAAVDEYQDLLRVSVASAGNDHRLGANEAPPAIVSMFLGEELTNILDSLADGTDCPCKAPSSMLLGVNLLPPLPKDTTDRNRTSPFAFTGNKFEFRMLGSSFSVSGPNFVLNTIIADKLSLFADQLENEQDFSCALSKLVKETYQKHRRIVFNGNNYAQAWVEEAQKRGLSNLKSTVDALPAFISRKSIDLFSKFGVLNETEIHSRYEIVLENYCKTINIEALTMTDMVRKQILPALSSFSGSLARSAQDKLALVPALTLSYEKSTVASLSRLADSLDSAVVELEKRVVDARMLSEVLQAARYYHDEVLPAMAEVRSLSDCAELLMGEAYYPIPTYEQLLYSV